MRRAAMILAGALSGCVTPTSFEGPAKVKDGPAGCRAVCDGWGMELAGMVKMGEYSDGCICQVKPKAPAGQAPAAEGPLSGASSAAIPASAGVSMQMAAAAAAQHQAMMERQRQTGTTPQHPYVPGSPIGSPGWRPGLP